MAESQVEPAELMEQFLEHCEHDRHYSPATCKAYGSDLQQFLDHMRARGAVSPPDQIMPQDVAGFIAAGRHLKAATQRRKLDALPSFFRYAVRRGVANKPR